MDKSKAINAITKTAKEKKLNFSEKEFNKTFKELGVDSITSISLLIDVETKLNVKIPDEKLTEIKTPNDLVKILLEL